MGQAIVFRGLSSSASGARNFMKMAQSRSILGYGGIGEVESAVEKLRPLACLIRSVRALERIIGRRVSPWGAAIAT